MHPHKHLPEPTIPHLWSGPDRSTFWNCWTIFFLYEMVRLTVFNDIDEQSYINVIYMSYIYAELYVQRWHIKSLVVSSDQWLHRLDLGFPTFEMIMRPESHKVSERQIGKEQKQFPNNYSKCSVFLYCFFFQMFFLYLFYSKCSFSGVSWQSLMVLPPLLL